MSESRKRSRTWSDFTDVMEEEVGKLTNNESFEIIFTYFMLIPLLLIIIILTLNHLSTMFSW
jgi:hypothetical protein